MIISERHTYFSIINYFRKDNLVAHWLERRMECFRFPVKLAPDDERPGRWDEHLTALCPCYGQRFTVSDDMLGQQIACPLESCGKPLQLNPFVASSGPYTSSDDTEKNNLSS
jgi:hypothetical protein